MQVDGQPVHVLTGGADVSELTEQDLEALRAIARAGKRYMEGKPGIAPEGGAGAAALEGRGGAGKVEG